MRPSFDHHNLKDWLVDDHLRPSEARTFSPWSTHLDSDGFPTSQPYYSIFQLYTLDYTLRSTSLLENAAWLMSPESDTGASRFAKRREWAAETIASLQPARNPRFDAVVLCQLIASRYYFQTQTDGRTITLREPALFDDNDWHNYCLNWDHSIVLQRTDFRIEDIREYQEMIAQAARHRDPLERWYDLVSFIAVEQKRHLKGAALLARTLYEMEHMLRLLYQDLCGERLAPPGGDLRVRFSDGGSEVQHVGDVRYLRYVANKYHLNPQPKLVLFVEGHGEMSALPDLAKRVYGAGFDHCGIQVRLLEGVQGFEGKKKDSYGTLERVIEELHSQQTIAFVILDNEGRTSTSLYRLRDKLAKKRSRYRRERTITRREYIHIWHKSVEFDNFTDLEIADALTEVAEHRYIFSAKEIRQARESVRTEGNPLGALYREKLCYQLPKVQLVEVLFRKLEIDGENGQRPIVIVLREIVHLAALNHQPTLEATDARNQSTGYLGHPTSGTDPLEGRFRDLLRHQALDVEA